MRNVLLLTSNIFKNLYAGDSIYTFNIAKLISEQTKLTIFGFGLEPTNSPLSECSNNIHSYPKPTLLRAAWTVAHKRLPIMQARHYSQALLGDVCEFLEAHPDTVVLVDHLRMAWLLTALREKTGNLFFMAHNCETDVARQALEKEPCGYLRWLRRKEHERVRAAEESTLELAKGFSAITEEDSRRFARLFGSPADLVLIPGYDAEPEAAEFRPAARPRKVLFSGGFYWHLKRRNFAAFLEKAAPSFEEHEIGLVVIGSGPERFLDWLQKFPFLELHSGEVDLAQVASRCRLALSIDEIGGGFKLKNLEYIQQGLPIVAMEGCQSGLPLIDKEGIFICQDIPEAVRLAVQLTGDIDLLEQTSKTAQEACSGRFSWASRSGPLLDFLAGKE